MKSRKLLISIIFVIALASVLFASSCLNLGGLTSSGIDISRAEISLEDSEFAYSGAQILPQVSVKYQGAQLTSDDYELIYANNINVGRASVTVKGKGKYKGNKVLYFTILESGIFSLDTCEISLSYDSCAYTGEEMRPSVIVRRNGAIIDGSYYTVEYQSNVQVGKASVIVKGAGDCSGEKTLNFDIYYQYVFTAQDATLIDGQPRQQVVDKSDVIPPKFEKRGYTFDGWRYDGKTVDFSDVDSVPDKGGEFTAAFRINDYNIDYRVDGGENNENNPQTYTELDKFDLQAPTRGRDKFAGWYLDEKFNYRIETVENFAQNLTLYAKWVNYESRKVNYIAPADANVASYDMFMPNDRVTGPIVISDDGKKELVWYLDAAMTRRLNYLEMPYEDMTIYSRWEDALDEGFLGYESFDVIDSFDKLVAYIDYVGFNNVLKTDSSFVEVTYKTDAQQLMSDIQKAIAMSAYPTQSNMWYSAGTGRLSVYLTDNLLGELATVKGMQDEDFYPQINNVFALSSQGREDGYDRFAVDYIEKTREVSNSDQLFYVLSHGYRPVPVAGSSAERIYSQFRDIMRNICDDEMTDFEKVKAIYEWIIVNVNYDNYVAYGTMTERSHKYEAFYLEGVLNGSAVCDGMSKAFSVMCAIEGIDCVRVTGRRAGETDGHAWNKVQIMGDWYLTDATWGNQTFKTSNGDGTYSRYEFFAYNYLLFTDYEREFIDGYSSNQYHNYVANTDFDMSAYYDGFELSVGSYTADLLIDSEEELSYVFEYVDDNFDDVKGMSVDLILNVSGSDVYKFFSSAWAKYRKRHLLSTAVSYKFVITYSGKGEDNSFEQGAHVSLIFDVPA